MQKIFQRTQALIGMLLATVFLVISTLTIAPAPARADCTGCVFNLEGQGVAFVAGFVFGVVASGSSLPAAAGAIAAAAGGIVAAPIVAPLAIGTAAVGGVYAIVKAVEHVSNP